MVTSAQDTSGRARVPRDPRDDYTDAAAQARRQFLRQRTGADLHHVGRYSFDPSVLPGNIENFTGVAQVPIGVAGPLRIHGEHARGDFYLPLATTEGTLVTTLARVRPGPRAQGGGVRPLGGGAHRGDLQGGGVHHPHGPLPYLRMNFTTGDAAGQNMTGKAALAAC